MSASQMFLLWAWAQFPLGGLALMIGEEFSDKIGWWVKLNFSAIFVSFGFWALYHLIMSWGTFA